ncbi:draxin [Dunckerocampus dactyliophorus]|uniref:draxin n=1 Tax=Dunckerocampus dactyliophorus TaxID=161453 RepID=UPI0024070B1C|nr:draxin [Dunckerocampus dactyliophorus]XP_054640975.1 draxin [Dunckerocampus dactyliophorus]XP_054640976.1 draxin [Dunckerocampus dactyliophorus]XP_054640977.1 draxin [Dunckerocampus dactyliophorus]
MMAPSLIVILVVLLAAVALSLTTELGAPRSKRRHSSGGGGDTQQHSLQAAQGYSKDRFGDGSRASKATRGRGGPSSRRSSHPLARPEDDGTGLEGLHPVRVEMGPGRAGMKKHPGENHLMMSRKGRGHEHRSDFRRQGGRRDKGQHGQGFLPDPQLRDLLHHPPPSPFSSSPSLAVALPSDAAPSSSNAAVFGSGFSIVATVMNEHPPTLTPASTKPQKSGRGKGQGEVMPTLDMALFDWTDYEDMKPVDTWPSSRKKDKRRSKNLSSGNATVDADIIEPCDHHLDCLPGSCCDLRQHECKAHNRGLNNKCYDDCMCEEGFRCYAKFHRKRRVTRRRGRCVVPESVSSDQGGFITI